MQQILHFSINGEFVTNTAREIFYEKHDLYSAIDIIKSATETDQLTEDEHLLLCLDIIVGKKNIVGTYPGDDYGVEDIDPENKIDVMNTISTELKSAYESNNKLEHELQIMMQKFLFLCDDIPDYKLRTLNDKYNDLYDEPLFEQMNSHQYSNDTLLAINKYNQTTPANDTAIDSYLTHSKNSRDDDYGWLEPNGTYHIVPWGNHSEWAREYCEKHYPYRTHANMYHEIDENGNRHHYVNGDFLVHKLHWILLDSPFQGVATPKYDPVFGMTKQQKEFLYDYYIERNMNDKANEIWKEEI